ncbi:MAG: sulfatase [Planctomycetales bacterium]
MRRWGFSLFLCLSLIPLTAVFSAEKLNVLFLVADDLNCDLGCYGHPHTKSPHIDALAKSGVRFDRTYCQYPLCSPSRSSFLTGRRPNATRVITNPRGGRLSTDYTAKPHFRDAIPDTVTLPQLFKNAGAYAVRRIGKLYHYGVPGQIGTSGLDDLPSWEMVINPAGRDKAEENKVFSLRPGTFGGTVSWLKADGNDEEFTDGLAATSAISQLEEFQRDNKPFFLAVGFYRPHTPYVFPKKYAEPLQPETFVLPTLSEADKKRIPAPAYASAHPEQDQMSDALRREAMQAYWGSIAHMDAQVGRVLAALDRLKLRDKTVVVFTSDHGYHMAQHGLWQKMSLFENSARVPLIISAPGMAGNGKGSQSLTELVDIYPTLADLCELNAPPYLDGKSLKPVLQDPAAKVKDVAYTQVNRTGRTEGAGTGLSLRTEKWRYTLWNDGKDGEQLFDMEKDPGETTNLAEKDPPAAIEELRLKAREYAARK